MDHVAWAAARENGRVRKAAMPRVAGTALACQPAALRKEQAGFDTLGRLE